MSEPRMPECKLVDNHLYCRVGLIWVRQSAMCNYVYHGWMRTFDKNLADIAIADDIKVCLVDVGSYTYKQTYAPTRGSG